MNIKSKRIIPALILSAGILLISSSSFAQSRGSSSGGTSVEASYLSEENLPDAKAFLPSPTKPGDPLFDGDLAYYRWGKTLRDTPRGQKAHDDAESGFSYMCSVFSPAVGVELSYEKTPAICKLLSRTAYTSSAATRNAKNFYKRTRPFDEFSEGTGVPEKEESYHGTASYPSGHSTRGWTMALILCELFPSHANEILEAGYQYGESRVIVGYHYESDVQAARISSSAVVSVLHSDPVFCRDMKKAKKEAARLSR